MPKLARNANTTGTLDWALLVLTLVVTAALSLGVSANKLLGQDEFLSFYTDGQRTATGVVDVQLHYPISLDPPTYHLLSHAAMVALGQTAIALRLPALLGFLCMQVALFALVRRLAGARAGVIAALLPVLTSSFRYTSEGRPYAWLLGLYAVAFACWYVAAERLPGRGVALAGMAAAIALAITSHYFGVLILVPVCFAEAARSWVTRRADGPLVAAGAIGTAALALDLPFQKALAPYRTHYYITQVSVRAISQGYRELFLRYGTWPMALQKAAAVVLAVATIALMAASWRRYRYRPEGEPVGLWAGLLGFASLPLFGFLIGRFVTHTMEVRYVIATLLAFVIAGALLLEPSLRSRKTYLTLYAVLLAVAIAIGGVNLAASRAETRASLQSMQPSAALRAAAAAEPGAPVYVQALDAFFQDTKYVADPALRARFALIYDEPLEVGLLQHNTNAVTAVNMQHFTNFRIVPQSDFVRAGRPLFLHYDTSWEWEKKELDATGITLSPLGATLRGELFRVGR